MSEKTDKNPDAAGQGRGKVVRILRTVGGVLLIILGIIGLFLPVLQGILFLFLGAALLGKDTRAGRWVHDRVTLLSAKLRRKKRKPEST